MKNLMKSVFLLAIVAMLSAMTTTTSVNATAAAPVQIQEEKPEVFASLIVGQPGPGQVRGVWNSSCPPTYNVYLFDVTLGTILVGNAVVNGNTWTFGGLTVGHVYFYSVTDCDSTIGKAIKVLF